MITRYTMETDTETSKSLQILLAEDNQVNQKLAMRLLEKRGHHVTIASNGREALSALEKKHFDLVLMDVQMPEMDGLEATRLLREKEKSSGQHQAVVAMTALVMKGDRERCMAAGMDGYLSKPIRQQELDDVLDTYLALDRPSLFLSKPDDLPETSVCVEELLERIDGDRGFLSELLVLFLGDYPAQIQSAREAMAINDAVELQRVGHALKGALGNLAAPIASGIAGELESMGRSGNISLAGARVDELEKELKRVIQTLEEMSLEVVK